MENVQLSVGNIYDGKVTRVKPFGALVSLPNGQLGLVHISHISNKYIEDINDHIKIDDEVKVKLLSIEEEGKKISLSIKEAMEKPNLRSGPGPRIGSAHGSRPQNQTPQKKFEPKKINSDKPVNEFEDKISQWLKSSNETQATLNRRSKRK